MHKIFGGGALILFILISIPLTSQAQTQGADITQLKAIVASLQAQLNVLINLLQQKNSPASNIARSDNGVITILSPNGGEVWDRSKSQKFKWRVVGDREVNINLDNVDTGARYGTMGLLKGGKSSNGEISWDIPINYPAGHYKVFISAGIGNDYQFDSSDNYFTIINQSQTAEDEVWRAMNDYYIENKKIGPLNTYNSTEQMWDKWRQTVYLSDKMMGSCLDEKSNNSESYCYSQFYRYFTEAVFDGFYDLLVDRSKATIRTDGKQAIVNHFVDLTTSPIVREAGSSFPGKSIITTYLIKKDGKWLIAYNSAYQVGMDLVALGIPHDDKDKDLDGLMDNIETCVWAPYGSPISNCRKVDPGNPDTDEDGWWDGIEVFVFGSSPIKYETLLELTGKTKDIPNDATIKGEMASVRGWAEIYFDGNSQRGYSGMCLYDNNIKSAIEKNKVLSGYGVLCNVSSDGQNYAMTASLSKGYVCVDSTGYLGTLDSNLSVGQQTKCF